MAGSYDDSVFVKALIAPIEFFVSPCSINLGKDCTNCILGRHGSLSCG